MDYLIRKFLHILSEYSVDYDVTAPNDKGEIELVMKDLPIPVDAKMARAEYNDSYLNRSEFKEEDIKYRRTVQSLYQRPEKVKMAKLGKAEEINGVRCIRVILSPSDYARKLNLIDSILRDYIHK